MANWINFDPYDPSQVPGKDIEVPIAPDDMQHYISVPVHRDQAEKYLRFTPGDVQVFGGEVGKYIDQLWGDKQRDKERNEVKASDGSTQ